MVIDADTRESDEIFTNFGAEETDTKMEIDRIINVEELTSEMIIPYGEESVW